MYSKHPHEFLCRAPDPDSRGCAARACLFLLVSVLQPLARAPSRRRVEDGDLILSLLSTLRLGEGMIAGGTRRNEGTEGLVPSIKWRPVLLLRPEAATTPECERLDAQARVPRDVALLVLLVLATIRPGLLTRVVGATLSALLRALSSRRRRLLLLRLLRALLLHQPLP